MTMNILSFKIGVGWCGGAMFTLVLAGVYLECSQCGAISVSQAESPDRVKQQSQSSSASNRTTSLEGSYELADDCHPIAGLWGKPTVHVQAKGEGQWWLTVNVFNIMGCLVTRAGESLTVGPIWTTLMLPPPPLDQLEREMSELLAGLTDIRLDGADLILKGAGRKERFSPVQ